MVTGILSSDSPHQVLIRSEEPLKNEFATVTPELVSLLPALGFVTYIAPAIVSIRSHRWWTAFVFLVLAILGTSHGACDKQVAGFGLHARCSARLQHVSVEVLSSWSCLCFLSVAFILLGPEDPWLNGCHTGVQRIVGVPRDVFILTRVLPALVLYTTLVWNDGKEGSQSEIWRTAALTTEMLLCIGCVAYWLTSEATEVLFRARFWYRAFRFLALPSVLLAVLALVVKSSDFPELFALIHLVASAAAASTLRAIFNGGKEEACCSTDDIFVPQALLCLPATIMLPAVLLSLLGDWWQMGWRWPSLSQAAASDLGSLVMMLSGPPLAIAVAGALWVTEHSPPSGPPVVNWCTGLGVSNRIDRRRLACCFGYASIAFGMLSAFCFEGTHLGNTLHTTFAILFFSMTYAGTVILAAESDVGSFFGRLRACMASMMAVGMPAHAILFAFFNQFVKNDFSIHPAVYAISEYVQLALIFIMPVTVWEEAKLLTS